MELHTVPESDHKAQIAGTANRSTIWDINNKREEEQGPRQWKEKESKDRSGKWNELMIGALLVFTTRGIKAVPHPTYISVMQPL